MIYGSHFHISKKCYQLLLNNDAKSQNTESKNWKSNFWWQVKCPNFFSIVYIYCETYYCFFQLQCFKLYWKMLKMRYEWCAFFFGTQMKSYTYVQVRLLGQKSRGTQWGVAMNFRGILEPLFTPKNLLVYLYILRWSKLGKYLNFIT